MPILPALLPIIRLSLPLITLPAYCPITVLFNENTEKSLRISVFTKPSGNILLIILIKNFIIINK